MKLRLLSIAVVAACLVACGPKDYTVHVKTPARPAGQQDVVSLSADPIETVRIGFIGLGMRGGSAVKRYTHMPGVEIKAICDMEEKQVSRSQKTLAKAGLPEAAEYCGEGAWKQLCEREDIDLVYVCTDWASHAEIGVYAMEHGKHVAIEVPAATSLEEIWALINTSEHTRRHCMQLENCCYDFFEMSALAAAQAGAFGEIIHAEGAYCHNLDPYWSRYWHSWRLDFNQQHKGDVYPTHGLGPVCQVLGIHRGDRMTTLVAMDTDPFNGPRHCKARGGQGEGFANGDETSTLIRTEKGKTILIEHDVMTPRPYSRMYQLVGTDGYAAKYPLHQVCLREDALGNLEYDKLGGEKVYSKEEADSVLAQYPIPILTPELEATAKEVGGHGGMDFIMDYRLIYCLRNGLPLDMDVYDLAEWCCLGELGAISIANGNAPVEVPDFTRGAWDKLDGFSYAFAK